MGDSIGSNNNLYNNVSIDRNVIRQQQQLQAQLMLGDRKDFVFLVPNLTTKSEVEDDNNSNNNILNNNVDTVGDAGNNINNDNDDDNVSNNITDINNININSNNSINIDTSSNNNNMINLMNEKSSDDVAPT